MILADTSVWIDHLRAGDEGLAVLLGAGRVLIHPFVIGELALGSLRQRDLILSSLSDLPACVVAQNEEVMAFIDGHMLFGRGIGYVDAHLLASVALTPEARLMTRDRRLNTCAEALGFAASR
jgi:predicted nucleic acid-binding protein